MQTESRTFTTPEGHRLAARLDLPDGDVKAFALFAHCFTCGKNLKSATHLTRVLAQRGIATLRFDFTGLGESEGDFADTGFASNISDVVAAAAFLEAEYQAPQLLIGHSLGGAAVLQAAQQIPSARAVVTLGAPSCPDHVLHLLDGERETIEREGRAEVQIGGRRVTVGARLVEDLGESRMREVIHKLGRALLILHSPFDEVVGIDHATRIFTAALHPKSFITLDRADHLLTDRADAIYAGEVIAAWASRYLAPTEEAEQPAADEGEVLVSTGRGHYRTEIQTRHHRLVADEPTELGGTDAGPTPYGYLLAALGACTSITLRMYADRRKWPLEAVKVRLRHRKVHCEDCLDPDTR
ncbi:MAG: alpha/beta fold hydrolase, partial [Pseudomonadota bacterium]|nr:alpha/beta fold hydrolase [Pseudomonadota bacterium]